MSGALNRSISSRCSLKDDNHSEPTWLFTEEEWEVHIWVLRPASGQACRSVLSCPQAPHLLDGFGDTASRYPWGDEGWPPQSHAWAWLAKPHAAGKVGTQDGKMGWHTLGSVAVLG